MCQETGEHSIITIIISVLILCIINFEGGGGGGGGGGVCRCKQFGNFFLA